MKEILKRLEIIRSSIAIEEDEIIGLQLQKLDKLELDEEVFGIINLVHEANYETVSARIADYLNKHTGLVVYEDSEIQGLKLELKMLEVKLQELTNIKNDYLHSVDEFNAQYTIRLGPLIARILKLRKEWLSKAVEEDSDYQDEYQEAKEQYDSFQKEYEEQIKDAPLHVSEEEQQQLKMLYRKASKLCHPDVVDEKQKDRAEEIFKELNNAYRKQDIARIEELLVSLETGESFKFSSDTITDKKLLRKKAIILRTKIKQTQEEINEIQSDEIYQTIIDIDDWDEYFNNLEKSLKEELKILEQAS